MPYHKVSLYLRAYTWLSLGESWREAPERGAEQSDMTERAVRRAAAGRAGQTALSPLVTYVKMR